MADKKSGPVKPPIIDATPRNAGKDPQTAKADAGAAEAVGQPKPDAAANPSAASAKKADAVGATAQAKPDSKPGPKPSLKLDPKPEPKSDAGEKPAPRPFDTPKPARADAAPAIPVLALIGAAGAGGLIGLALAYGLASSGYWPQSGDGGAAALADLEGRTAQLERSLAEPDAGSAQLAARIDAVEADLAARIEDLAGAAPSTEGLAAQADVAGLETRIEDLATRLDALASGASGEQSGEIAGQITQLSGTVADLSERLEAIEPELAELAPGLQDAQARLDDLDARIVDQAAFEAVSAERDRFARLPAALDGLEQAIGSGGAFAPQLAAVEALLPDLAVSDQARSLAASGVETPEALANQFASAIPAILAARPPDPDSNWAQSLLGQAASAIALRPTEGDSQEALVGRVETALEAGDLDGAQQAFSALPPPMQEAAASFADDLAASLAAQDLMETARGMTQQASAEDGAAQQ